MKNFPKLLATGSLAIASTAAVLTLGGVAQAALLNATLGFVPFGTTTFTGANLGSATAIDFPSLNLVNDTPATFTPVGGSPAPNDFNAGGVSPLAPVAISSSVTLIPDPYTLSPGLPFTVSFTAGGQPATFTASTFSRSSSGANALDLRFIGTITGTGFDPSQASLSFAFTTTGSGGSVNYSATLASPPAFSPTGTPEPTTLLGLGAVATLGFFGRKKKSNG